MKEILQTAEKILFRYFDQPRLTYLESLGDYLGARNILFRCRLETQSRQAPETLILKYPKIPKKQLFQEWASLEFLQRFSVLQTVFPRLYGGDRDEELLLIEDISSSEYHLLGYVLEGTHSRNATTALLDFSRLLGKLHATTLGRFEDYHYVRKQYPPSSLRRYPIDRISDWMEYLQKLPQVLALPPVKGWEEALLEIQQHLDHPGPFLAFTHGEATPASAFYEGAKLRLFDLETGDFRHALLDVAFLPLRYLYSAWGAALPESLSRELLELYRQELAVACPSASDPVQFGSALMNCSLVWLAGLLAFVPSVRLNDCYWGRTTLRQRILTALEYYLKMTEYYSTFPAVVTTLQQLSTYFQKEWYEVQQMPVYKALESQ